MRKQIKHLMLINSFFVFAINMFAPLYASYIQKMDVGVVNIGGIWSFYILSVGILAYFVSRWKHSREYVSHLLILGFVFRATGWMGYIFAGSVWQLYLIQLFLALGEAMGSLSYNSLFAAHLDNRGFSPEWGFNMSINSFITGGAPLIGAAVVYTFGFGALFVFMIGLSFISTMLAFRYMNALCFPQDAGISQSDILPEPFFPAVAIQPLYPEGQHQEQEPRKQSSQSVLAQNSSRK
ncbi:Uncharacterised protein [uncultured archaeon]|nr:Uncharacterised protein [uncultured archaeon]